MSVLFVVELSYPRIKHCSETQTLILQKYYESGIHNSEISNQEIRIAQGYMVCKKGWRKDLKDFIMWEYHRTQGREQVPARDYS